jgi:HD-like signal output (HDOD) protein
MQAATTQPGRPPRQLADAELPVMPHTARELRRLLGLPSTRAGLLQEVLLRDPAAAVAVLRRLGRLRPSAAEQVTDLAHALSLVGLDTLPELLGRIPALSGSGTPAADPRDGYSTAVHAAAYAGQLARRLGPAQHASLATAALLQSPAVIALWSTDPAAAARATRAARRGVPGELAWSEQLGAPLEQVNRALAQAWCFPGLARQALALGESRSRSEQAVWLAAELARSSASGWNHPDTGRATRLLADFLGLEPDQAAAWLRREAVEAARALAPCGYPAPGFELLYMPGDEAPTEDSENDQSAGADTASAPADARRTEAGPAGADIQALVTGFMRRIQSETGSTRVLFAMLSRDRRRLRTRLVLGIEPGHGLGALDLELGQRHLLGLLMGKPQSLWLRPDNAARYLELLPAEQRGWLDASGSYLMSLFAGEHPLGLLYAGGSSTGESGYLRFRELCQATAGAMAAATGQQRAGA